MAKKDDSKKSSGVKRVNLSEQKKETSDKKLFSRKSDDGRGTGPGKTDDKKKK